MVISKKQMTQTVRRWYGSRLAVIIESIIIGAAVGFVVVLFRYLLVRAEDLRTLIYQALPGLPFFWTLCWGLALALAGLFLGWIAKKRPMIRGSGIPQIKGALLGQMTLDWVPELPLKLVTGILGLGAGLSLGREGPSIQIGAYVGKGVLSIFRRPEREQQFLITGASAAGLAAAFNAPLAGVLFALEELQSSFTPLFLACAMGASMAAAGAAALFFGLHPIFDFRDIAALPLRGFPWVVLLGIICGLLGDLFKRGIYCSLNLYDRFRIPPILRPVIPLAMSVPLGFLFFDITGGGHALIESLSMTERSLTLILLLLAGKLLFTALCYGSGTSGGIFLPLLACGALAGIGLGKFLAFAGITTPEQNLNFMILGMAAFFSGVVKAPVTGIILILEMSGNFNHLWSLVLVSLSAFVTADLIASRPIYTVLLERMVKPKVPDQNSWAGNNDG
ncbi:ClC family H(+)/Cl(-) exchange transporter [Treponema sp. TIM-1]|uniref:ClC family H(+)/Cl(-) exchange transporter n=1 Tax=Treponema sp. TIM-1 TaxID=2898417 RepID=UPI00397FC518